MYLTLALKSTWGVHGLYGPCILCAWWWCVAVVCVCVCVCVCVHGAYMVRTWCVHGAYMVVHT